MIGRLARAATPALLLALLLSAHIGDDNTYFTGFAGPWSVQVTVRHPGVVPGLADIAVRVENGTPERVAVRPVRIAQGLEGAPRPDVAEPVPGQPGMYMAQLWFMTLGAYSVHVEVAGSLGEGVAIVPVTSNATRTLPLGRGLGIALVALGLFLAVGLLSIVRAATGESTLPPHEAPGPAHRRRARIAVGVAIVLLFLVVSGGRAWWRDEADNYRGILFVPLELHAQVGDSLGVPVIDLAVADRNWLGDAVRPLVPDHGKLMHAFLFRLPDGEAFAHVHPEPTGNLTFRLVAPPLPAGRYSFVGDIVHADGMTQTLSTEIDLPAAPDCENDACPRRDSDDSWTVATAVDGDTFPFDDGLRIRWHRPEGPIEAGRAREFRFEVTDASGAAVALEPYMGMAAHAAVRRDDGTVFVHLHPTGTISMAAQTAMASRVGIDAPDSPDHTAHDLAVADGTVEMFYAFPRDGQYRVWLQVRVGGSVRTAVWSVRVGGADPGHGDGAGFRDE